MRRSIKANLHIHAWVIWLLGAAIILVLVVHLVFLTHYPPVFFDEPMYANAAWNWLTTGANFDSMRGGTLDQFGTSTGWPYLGNLPWVASFAMFGLGLFQARLVSWCFGLLLLLATVWVGRRNYSLLTGALAALLLALSPAYTQASHYVRPDIMLAVVVMVVFGLAHKALTEERWWAHLLAGLLLGVALDIHQNASLFGLGLVAMYYVTYGRQMFRRRGTWLCAVGGLVGIGYYVAVQLFPDPGAYLNAIRIGSATVNQPPLLTLNPADLVVSAIREVDRYHFFENNLDFALIGAGIALLMVRRARSDRLLLSFVAAAFAGFVLFAGNKNDIYAVLFYPVFMLMVAEALLTLIRSERGLDLRRVFAGGLLLMLLVYSGKRFARPLVQNRAYNYYAITEQIRRVSPPGARIMGLPYWWLGLADYDYRSSLNLTYYHHLNGFTLTEGLQAIHPDIIIMDYVQQSFLRSEGYFQLQGFAVGQGHEMYYLPAGEFNQFLAQRGRRLIEFTDPWHGQFEVYAVDWQ
jgi:4-amino-4-deoxy-L-arabinose transferase-like glycosyltransferase